MKNKDIFYNEAASIPIDIFNSVVKLKPKKEEHKLQSNIVRFLRLNRILCFSVPNGGSRNAREMVNLKKEGLLSGVSDLIVLLPNKAVFVEIKTDKGKQSQEQKDFMDNVKSLGFDYLVWRSIDDAIDFVTKGKEINNG